LGINVKNGIGVRVPLNNSTRIRRYCRERSRRRRRRRRELPHLSHWVFASSSGGVEKCTPIRQSLAQTCSRTLSQHARISSRDRGVVAPLGDWRWPLIGLPAKETAGRAKRNPLESAHRDGTNEYIPFMGDSYVAPRYKVNWVFPSPLASSDSMVQTLNTSSISGGTLGRNVCDSSLTTNTVSSAKPPAADFDPNNISEPLVKCWSAVSMRRESVWDSRLV
jgi:hypothetical protein